MAGRFTSRGRILITVERRRAESYVYDTILTRHLLMRDEKKEGKKTLANNHSQLINCVRTYNIVNTFVRIKYTHNILSTILSASRDERKK